jgi:hypothetical protein
MAQMSYLDLKNLVNGFYERNAFDKVRAGFENSLGENRVWAVLDQLLGPTTGASKEARIIGLEMLLQDLKQFRTKGPARERLFVTEDINNISLQGSSSIYNWVKGEYEFESIVRNQNRELLRDQAKELKKFNVTPQTK